MVLEGAVVRQRMLSDGRCQTVAIYYCDDVINLLRFLRRHETTDNLVALRGTVMASVQPEVVEELRAMSLTGIDGMAALVLRELSICEEHLMCTGRRSASESLSHFLCEALVRSRGRDDRSALSCAFAMTQDMIAETLGLTSVHVNRTMLYIRSLGYADLSNNRLIVHDFAGLSQLAEFDEAYLAPV